MLERYRQNKEHYIRILYVVMLVSYIASVLLYWTVMDRILPGAFDRCLQLVRYLSYALAALIALLRFKEIGKKDRLFLAGILLLCLAGTYFSRDKMVFLFFLIFLASYKMDDRLIVRTVMLTQIIILAVVVIPAMLGAGTDYIVDFQGRSRHAIGFTWTTFAPFLLLYISLAFLYLAGEKVKIWHLGIFAAIGFFFYLWTDTRSTFFVGIAFYVVYYLIMRGRKNQPGRLYTIRQAENCIQSARLGKGLSVFLTSLPALAAVFSVYIYGTYRETYIRWKINYLLSRRLQYGKAAIDRFGYTWFGQKIEWVGHSFGQPDTKAYNFVDGSYLHILLQNGIVILAVVVAIYMVLIWRASRKNDLSLCLILAFISILNITEERLMFPAFNPFPLLVMSFAPFFRDRTQEADERGEGSAADNKNEKNVPPEAHATVTPDSSEATRSEKTTPDSSEATRSEKTTPDSSEATTFEKTTPDSCKANSSVKPATDSSEAISSGKTTPDSSEATASVKTPEKNKSMQNSNQQTIRKAPSLKKNAIMNGLLTISSFIFPLITFPYVSRVLGPAGTGRVSFATNFLAYFSMFAEMGIPTYGIRMCAQVRDDREELNRTVQEILILNFFTTLLTYIVFGVVLFTVPRVQRDKTLFLIMSLTLVFNTIGMEWLYKALEQYTYITVRSLVFKILALAGTFALIHSSDDYIVYGFLTIFAASASNIFNLIHVRHYISLKPVGHYNLKKHLKPLAVFFAMSCAVTIYTKLDAVMLGFMQSDEEVGYYDAAVKIKNVLSGIVSSLGAVLLPRASYYVEHNLKEEFTRISEKALHFVVLVSLPMVLYFTIFAREGILFLSGDQYAGAIVPMQIIMGTVFFIGMTNIMGMEILVPSGREKAVLISEIAGGIVDFLINLILIPRIGCTGAAIAALSAEGMVWLVQFLFLRGMIIKAYRKVPFGRILLALAVSTACSVWVKTRGWNSFISLAISAVIFFALYLVVLYAVREPITRELANRYLFRKKKQAS